MIPVPNAGVKPWIGKKNPVTVVAAVVTRKSFVHRSKRRAVSIPHSTTNPEKIPTRLIATCRSVYAVRITIHPLSRVWVHLLRHHSGTHDASEARLWRRAGWWN